MTILGIETTGLVCGSAVVRYGVLIAVNEIKEANVHDLYLMQSVRNVLSDAGLSFDDIDVVGVSCGPGSFTGTRIGVSFAKGLTLTNRPRLLGISTLESLVYAFAASLIGNVLFPVMVACVVESHGNRCFLQRFGILSHTSWDALSEIEIIAEHEITTRVEASDIIISPSPPQAIVPTPLVRIQLSASHVAMCVSILIGSKRRQYSDPLTFEPLYRQEFIGKKLP